MSIDKNMCFNKINSLSKIDEEKNTQIGIGIILFRCENSQKTAIREPAIRLVTSGIST